MSDYDDNPYGMQLQVYIRPDARGEVDDLLSLLVDLEDAEAFLHDREMLATRRKMVYEFAPDKQYAEQLLACLPNNRVIGIGHGFLIQESIVRWISGYVDTDMLTGIGQFILARFGSEDSAGCILHEKFQGDGVGFSRVIERDRITDYSGDRLAEEHLSAASASATLTDDTAYMAGIERLLDAVITESADQGVSALRTLVREQALMMTPSQRRNLFTSEFGAGLLKQAAAAAGEMGLLPEVEDDAITAGHGTGAHP